MLKLIHCPEESSGGKVEDSKQSFFDELNSADSITFWKTVRFLNNQQSSVATLQQNGFAIETASNKAAAFNNFSTAVSIISSPSNATVNHNNLEQGDCPKELLCTEEYVTELLINLDVTRL